MLEFWEGGYRMFGRGDWGGLGVRYLGVGFVGFLLFDCWNGVVYVLIVEWI